jgi:hypothetical protein
LVFYPHRIEKLWIVGPFGDSFLPGDYATARRIFLYAVNLAKDAGLKEPVLIVHVGTSADSWEAWASPLTRKPFPKPLTITAVKKFKLTPYAYFRRLLTTAWAEGFELNPSAYVVELQSLTAAVWHRSPQHRKRNRRARRNQAYSKLITAALLTDDPVPKLAKLGQRLIRAALPIDDAATPLADLGWESATASLLIDEAATTLPELCPASLTLELPQANRDGWLEVKVDGTIQLCRTRQGWAQLLKSNPPPGYPRIQKTAVLTRLASRPGINALIWTGRISPGTFHTLDVLRKIFLDHFALVDRQANDKGFFLDAQGIRLGTIPAWVNAFIESKRVPKYWAIHAYDNFVGRHLRQYCVAGDGIDNNGLVQRRAFYSESDAEFALALWSAIRRLTELQTPAGLMLCGSIGILVEYFASREDLPNINHWLFQVRLNQARQSGQLRGRSVSVHRRGYSVYGLPIALEVFAPEIEQHQARAADGKSYFRVNPVTGVVERYAPLSYWVDYVCSLGVYTNRKRLLRQLQALNVEAHILTLPVKGLRPLPLWPQSAIFSCRIVVDAVPELDEDNTLTVDEEQHHDPEFWAAALRISLEQLAVYLRETMGRLGKRRDGRVVQLYGQSALAQASETWRPAEANPDQLPPRNIFLRGYALVPLADLITEWGGTYTIQSVTMDPTTEIHCTLTATGSSGSSVTLLNGGSLEVAVEQASPIAGEP